MNENDNFYAAPEAELSPESPQGGGNSQRAAHEFASFGGAISGIFDMFQKLFVPLLGVALVWGVFDAGSDYAIELGAVSFMETGDITGMAIAAGVVTLLSMVVMVLVWGYGFQRAHNMFEGRPGGDEFDVAIAASGWLILFYILMSMMVGVGLLLCLIPGIILGTMLFVGDVVVVVEDRGPIEAIKRCFDLFDGADDWFYAFGVVLVASLIAAMVGGALGCVFGGVLVGAAGEEGAPLITALFTGALNIVVLPWMVSVSYVVYRGLDARRQGLDFDQDPMSAGDDLRPRGPLYSEQPGDDSADQDVFGAVDGYGDTDGQVDGFADEDDDDDDVKW